MQEELSQSRHCAIASLISGLNASSQQIVDNIQGQVQKCSI